MIIDRATRLEVLPRRTCEAHLSRAHFGRLAFAVADRIEILPVNFRWDYGRAMIGTGEGNIWAAANDGRPASLEIDETNDLYQTGWSVVVSGTLAVATPETTHTVAPRPWITGETPNWVELRPEVITGRRILSEDLEVPHGG